MDILSVHNEYLIKGGEDESRKAEAHVLEKYGHDITYFTEHNSKIKELSKIGSALRTIWSKESYRDIKNILRKKKHDIAHIQNFFPLISPSIYYAARSEKVPIIQAVRNYRLVCPAYTLYRDGHVCTDCVGKTIPYPGIIHKCYRDNMAASATVASMLSFHNLIDTWKLVDRYVCLSEFMKRQLIAGGFPVEKIIVKPNFVFPDPQATTTKENYIVYVGRLQAEKGIQTLLDAMALLKDHRIRLKVIGTGPLVTEVLKYTATHSNVEYLGERPLLETYEIIGKAKCLVIPSVWHEPFGRVVVEAYAKGTPVIGSNMGGIPELIKNEETGLTFTGGDVQDLCRRINWVYENNEQVKLMGLAARKAFLDNYTPEINYRMLMAIYESVR